MIGCVLYACSPILKYGKYSYKCRGLRGPYECSYITINPDSTYRSYSKFDAGAIDWTGKWSRIGNTLYAEETKDSMMRAIDSVILGFIRPPQRDTLIIKKNRLITETQKIKWKKGNKWETGRFIFKNSKTRFKYKFVPAENDVRQSLNIFTALRLYY